MFDTARGVDWNRVKVEYVTGNMGYKDLAARHKVNINMLARTARAEGWVAQRKEFRKNATDRAIDSEVANEAKRLKKLIKAADDMEDVIAKIFTDAEQFHRHVVVSETGASERWFEKVDTKAIRDLCGAMKDLSYVKRNLNSLPTQQEREAQRIAAERLKLEREKARLDEHADQSVKVEFEKDEEYAR